MGYRKVKIGLMQVNADYGWSVEKCQQQMLYLAEQCCKDGADIVFMPEFFQYKSIWHDSDPVKLVVRYSESYKQECSRIAKKYGAYVVPWDLETNEKGAVFNTSYILDRQGVEIGRYRKVHLTYDEEKAGISKGTRFMVFDLDFGRVGIMICFDNYYPESARILSLMGAELILYPLYGDTLKDQWEIKLKARAMDNFVHIASCHIHSSPKEAQVTYTGLAGPAGEVLGKVEEEGSYKVIEMEMGKKVITNTSGVKGKYEDLKLAVWKSRNPCTYGPLMEYVGTPGWDEIKIEAEEKE